LNHSPIVDLYIATDDNRSYNRHARLAVWVRNQISPPRRNSYADDSTELFVSSD
jgi:hypothetical protein